MADNMNDDAVQHGIDDNPNDDAKKGLELGALGGGTVGAIAGSLLGPVGTVVGALIGGSIGSVASGAAVQVVDAVDNDDTVTGVGTGETTDANYGTSGFQGNTLRTDGVTNVDTMASGDYEHGVHTVGDAVPVGGHNVVTGEEAHTNAGTDGLATGAVVGGLIGTAVGGPVGAVVGGTLGSLAGGVAGDASEAVDEVPADRRNVMNDTNLSLGNDVPGIQTGGTTTQGADTRGIMEKTADSLTGDRTDDKTGGIVGGTYGSASTEAIAPYGQYEGRDISRDEYNTLNDEDRMKVRLLEEELHVNKAERQIGEVEVSKRIVTEQVEVPVTLEREEIIIHRHAATGDVGAEVGDITDQTIVVPVREEYAEVTKSAHVAEEIEIERRVTSQEQTISDTVRREELDVTGNPQDRVRIDDQGRNNM